MTFSNFYDKSLSNSFPEETSGHKYELWSLHARRACLETRDARGQQRRGAPRASQKGDGRGPFQRRNHRCSVFDWSPGRDRRAPSIHPGERRENEWCEPHPRGAETHRQKSCGVITDTPPKRTRAFLSKD